MRLSRATVSQLAEMICGAHGTSNSYGWENFPYRSSSYLTEFFTLCDLPYKHDGSTRKAWVETVLTELNEKPARNAGLPSDELIRVITFLLDLSHFERAKLNHQLALVSANKVFSREGLQVNFVNGQCVLENLKTHSTSFQSETGRLPTREEITRKEKFSQFLDNANEDKFTEKLLVPLFKLLGFDRVNVTGHKDKQLEFGKDVWMVYKLPTGHKLFVGVQVKIGRIHSSGSALDKNIGGILSQLLMMLMYPVFDSETNSKHLIDNIYLVSSGEITKQARTLLSEFLDNGMRRSILFLDRDEILNLCVNWGLPLPDTVTLEEDEQNIPL
jgi:hypothetical protein